MGRIPLDCTFSGRCALVSLDFCHKWTFWEFLELREWFDTDVKWFSLPLLLLSSKYLENVLGTREFLRFLVFLPVSQALLCFCLWMEYFLFGRESLLFVSVYGFTSLFAGFLVAFKQMVPEHRIVVGGIITMRTKHVPSLFIFILGLATPIAILWGDDWGWDFFNILWIQYVSGSFSAWVYLRFYQTRDGIRGDRSETFSFVSFFPDATHKFLQPISNSVYALCVKLKLCPPILPARYTPLDEPQVPKPAPGSEEADAERRRALGLKALELKMGSNTKM